MRNRLLLLLAVLCGTAARPLAAQAASSTDVITGLVTDEKGLPVVDALVSILAVESQVTRTAKTNAKGRYTIVFPDGGGQYRLTVRMIGLTPVQRAINRQADEDRIVANVKMGTTPVQLQELRVQARRPGNGNQAPTAGSTERNLPTEQVQRLPIDAGDLLMLATLAPGVVSITGNDSTAGGFSVAGQRPTANNITLDGLSFGASQVPQDAIRSTRVITSSYDPARGQFSGGLIASTTRSGTNTTQGTGNYGFRDRALTVTAGDDAFSTGFNQHQLSFGLGGPLIKDKLFIFGSGLGRFRGDELQSLLSATPATLSRFGVAPDSALRLTSLLNTLGVPIDQQLAQGNRQSDDASSLLRIDWVVSQNHTLTFRGDYRGSKQEPTRVGPLSVPAGDARSSQHSGGFMMSANSRFGATLVNELRAYWSGSSSHTPLDNALPAGRVQVVSDLDQARGATSLTFGGISSLPQRASNTSFEATNELSLIPGDGTHRLKLGAFVNHTSAENDATVNRYGTFTFASLADLEAGQPASFTRTLAPTIRSTGQTSVAAYLADTWRLSDALQFTYGARIEGSNFDGAPARNPAVETLFGVKTDLWPSEWRVSPRIGFTWFIRSGDNGPPALVVRGGFGEFRSPAPGALFSSAQAAPGFGATEAQLTCIGAGTPIPDWTAYRQDPANIPSACLAGGPGPILSNRSPTVTAFSDQFTSPRALRASLGLQKRLNLITVGAELSRALGRSQFGVRDLNLGAAQFHTAADGRPVYVPAQVIDPATGTLPLFASRKSADYGNVLVFDSELESRSTQLTVTANGMTKKGGFFNFSYTWNRATDQSSFSAGGAQRGFTGQTTAGDPNAREWSTSDFERRHSLLLTFTYPLTKSVELTTISRLTSGAAFTPIVGEDVNGDGARNDRAFIFGAGAADTAVANGMSRLLATTSGGARSCLVAQAGRIADRNSCRGPWQPSLDFQVNIRPTVFGLNRKLTFSFVTSNFLVGLDQMLHGQAGAHGWGQLIRPDGTLLVVRGFDPLTQAFKYTVNERFGANAANTVAIRQPFQLGLQVRYTLGPDLLTQMRNGFGGGGRGGFGGQGGQAGPGGPGAGGGDIFTRMVEMAPNPALEVAGMKIALNLTDEQTTKLNAISDSTKARAKSLAERARKELAKAGPNPDPGIMFSSMRPIFQLVRENGAWALKETQAILTPEQWQQVPDRIKTPQQQRRGPPQ